MLRKKELLDIKTSDIDLFTNILKVYDKGRKERLVPRGIKWKSKLTF